MNPIIESLRVLGALMVMVHHYTYQLSDDLASSWFALHFFHNGVDLFFVITGYLFAPFLIGDKRVDIYKFFKRRFYRLYPLYLLSLFALVVTSTGNIPSISLLFEHVFLLQALPYHSFSETGAVSLVFWTLAVEFQFYLFVMALLLLYRYVDVSHKLLFLFVISIVFYLASVYINYQPKSERWVLWQAQLPALLIEFFFGIVVYSYRALIKVKAQSIVLFLLSCSLLVVLYLYYPSVASLSLTARPFAWFNLFSGLAYAGLLASLLAWQRLTPKCYPTMKGVAIFGGGLSYAVYLFHEVAILWLLKIVESSELRVFLAVCLTVLLAWGLNKFVENPAREYGRR